MTSVSHVSSPPSLAVVLYNLESISYDGPHPGEHGEFFTCNSEARDVPKKAEAYFLTMLISSSRGTRPSTWSARPLVSPACQTSKGFAFLQNRPASPMSDRVYLTSLQITGTPPALAASSNFRIDTGDDAPAGLSVRDNGDPSVK